jgi:hypothetical protein
MGGLTRSTNGKEHVPAERADDPPGAGKPRLTAAHLAALKKAKHEADIIKEAVFPAALASAVPLGNVTGPAGWKLYRDRLLEEAGSPTDPIERMMVEQLAMAHFRIGQLHTRVAEARTVDEAKAYSAAATRLTGEFRRLALALKSYRQPSKTKHFTVVRQQNLAQNQQVAQVNGHEGQNEAPSFSDDSELTSNRLQHARAGAFPAEPETGSRRAPEPAQARAADTRRPGEAAADRAETQAVAPRHRSEDTGGEGPVGGEWPKDAEG